MHLNIEYYSVRDSLPRQDHQSNQQNAPNKQGTYTFQPEFVKDLLVPIERKASSESGTKVIRCNQKSFWPKTLEFVTHSARQLKPIKKLMMKLTTKSQIEFGQARY